MALSPSSIPHIASPVTLCRLMQPGDANISGNVHGGTILKMIEEAGMIVTTRFCNQNKDEGEPEVLCALVRVERTDFCQPMYVGEVAHLHGDISFCSERSIEMQITVWGEDVMKNSKRLTNKASLWYVPMTNSRQVATVPKLQYSSAAQEEAGRMRYNKQKDERARTNNVNLHKDFSIPTFVPPNLPERGTVAHAQSSLIHLVNVNDCATHGNVSGGATMKMMDEAAGICAARHCHSNVVTASMDATDFHKPITLGCVMHLKSRPIFTSAKSMEIEVVVDVEKVRKVESGTEVVWFRACSAFFTFVSLDRTGRALPIQPLKCVNDEEKQRYAEGEIRYNERKKMRNKM